MKRKGFLWMILCVVLLVGFVFQSFGEKPKPPTPKEPLVIQEKKREEENCCF